MSNYKCINSFTDSNGDDYYYGKVITASTYQELTPDEQENFTLAETDDDEAIGLITDIISMMPDLTSSDSPSSDSSSDNSSSSDFGGGSFDGGGSSNDW